MSYIDISRCFGDGKRLHLTYLTMERRLFHAGLKFLLCHTTMVEGAIFRGLDDHLLIIHDILRIWHLSD